MLLWLSFARYKTYTQTYTTLTHPTWAHASLVLCVIVLNNNYGAAFDSFPAHECTTTLSNACKLHGVTGLKKMDMQDGQIAAIRFKDRVPITLQILCSASAAASQKISISAIRPASARAATFAEQALAEITLHSNQRNPVQTHPLLSSPVRTELDLYSTRQAANV